MNRQLIGHVGVDSGQLIITDPCYLASWGGNECDWEERGLVPDGGSLNDMYPAPKNLPYDYAGASVASCSEPGGAELDNGSGVSVRTGYGDGYYPVYVEYVDEGMGCRVARLIVEFL